MDAPYDGRGMGLALPLFMQVTHWQLMTHDSCHKRKAPAWRCGKKKKMFDGLHVLASTKFEHHLHLSF